MGNWYYARNKQPFGPIDEATFRGLCRSGQVVPSDMVWTDGMAGWVPAGSMPGLLPQQTSQAAPTPTAAQQRSPRFRARRSNIGGCSWLARS